MRILFHCPSKSSERYTLTVTKSENVQTFRQSVAEKLKVKPTNVRLFALGKMLLDRCADGKPAKLFLTYGIKENALVLVQAIDKSKKVNELSDEETVSTSTTQEEKEPSVLNSEPSSSSSSSSTPSTTETTEQPKKEEEEEDKQYQCKTCHNNDELDECSECGCSKCLKKSGDPLICDQCDMYWHLECVGLTSVPEDKYWYCPVCVNTDREVVISSGKAVDMSSSKKAKTRGAQQTKSWGGGSSCAGRNSECVIVPKEHVGAIPGIYCGQTWYYRMNTSEWGIHRPPVGGIAGSSTTGAVSIVLSAGYEDDTDHGDEFYYTGSGGRDLSNNKRVGGHATDQELTRFNLALAKTCAVKVNDKKGAEAMDWKKSRPIRVCRTSALAKHHPQYAPKEGVRYDGLYKIVKYWPQKGKSGFKVWRFLMRRDDPEPAPWTEEAKKWIEKRGLRMIMPDSTKTKKKVQFKLPKKTLTLMDADKQDKRVWDDIKSQVFYSEYEFLHYVFSEAVVCSSGACNVPIRNPITTPCGHICCLECLRKDSSKTCFSCRAKLSEDVTTSQNINHHLIHVLKALNPSYVHKNPNTTPSPSSSSKTQKTIPAKRVSSSRQSAQKATRRMLLNDVENSI
ncbi:hypothetical protein INT45_012563 [Circinella minor]|uniref:RING-type E3 ubiquitin transferase n=1 Tax=Circinella minor TaxID=1195481 RepID=A0A8H7S107_9FUNG|nr:hypothetical protein INT45_012563 [Circinella minor]